MYHRAYKSAREDQIGFQKYKIHGDIKKEKEEEAGQKVREKGEKNKEEERGKKSRETREEEKENACRRARNAA